METHLEKICQVCGSDSVGYQDLIVTCSRCSLTQEHPYCMRVLTFDIPEDWICDSCLSGNEMNLVESGGQEDTLMSSSDIAQHDTNMSPSQNGVPKSRWEFHLKKQRPVETGKVKFMSPDEVIALTSGASKSVSPIKTSTSLRSPIKMASFWQKNPTKARTVNRKSFPYMVEKATAWNHSGPSETPREGAAPKSPMNDKKNQLTSKEFKVERSFLQSGKWRGNLVFPPKDVEASRYKEDNFTKKSSCGPLSPNDPENVINVSPMITSVNKKIKTSRKKMETELAEEAPCPQLPSSKLPSDIGAVEERKGGIANNLAEDNLPNVEENELLNMKQAIGLYRTFFPTQLITWKGGFCIVDNTVSELIEGFQAQLPCRVHRKAYEASQIMPPVLQVKFLPRHHDFVDPFRDTAAGLADISLYFFSSADNTERSREMHHKLFERMEVQRSIMIGYVNDIELLIFTSKQLDVEFQNAFLSKTKKFFWGVFRKREASDVKSLCVVNEETPPMISPLECAYPDGQEFCSCEDMDIDMIGGEDIGRIDIVIRKDSPAFGSNQPISTKENLAENQIVVSREMDSSVQQQSSSDIKPKVKTEVHDKTSGSAKDVNQELFVEDAKFMASWRRLQDLCLGISPACYANAPPGFPEKATGSSLGIKPERN